MTDNKQEGKVKLRVDSWSNCFIFVFFVFFLFNLWQTVHERWLVEQIIDPETGSMSVDFHAEYIALGLVGIAVLVGIWVIRRWEAAWRFSRSTRLGIVLITSVLVATVFGTLIFQNASPQDYVNFYSEFLFSVFKAVHMLDLFASWWFLALLVLLAGNIIACTLHRKPWSLPKLGLLLTHAGIVLVVVGAFVGGVLKQEGVVFLGEGNSTSFAASDEYVQSLYAGFRSQEEVYRRLLPDAVPPEHRIQLGATLSLDDFEELYYDDPFIVRFERVGTRRNTRTGEEEQLWFTEQEITYTDTKPLALEGGRGVLRITGVYPRLEGEPRVLEVESGHPMAEIELSLGDSASVAVLGEESLRLPMFGGADEIFSYAERMSNPALPPIAFRLRFAWEPPGEESLREMEILGRETPYYVFPRVESEGHLDPIPLRTGVEAPIGGTDYSIELVRFFHDLEVSIDGDVRELTNGSDLLRNPAVEVRLSGGDFDEPLSLVLTSIGESPDHEMITELASERRLWLGFLLAPQTELIVVGSEQRLLVYSDDALQESVDLSSGDSYTPPYSSYSLRLVRTLRSAVVTPAVEVEVGMGEESRSALLECSDFATPMELRQHGERYFLSLDDNSRISFSVRGDYVRDWRSHVSVYDGDENIREHVIRVNEPLVMNGFYFYQQSWYPQLPYGESTEQYFTYLRIVRDPGLWTVYLGLVMMTLGIAYTFYVRPRLKGGERKEEDNVE